MSAERQRTIEIETRGPGLYEFTRAAHEFCSAQPAATGLLTLFVRHTSCSLLIQENVDPDVQRDLSEFFARLAPEGMDWLAHTIEGPDDMPAHIKAALTATTLSIPVAGHRPLLGQWQGIYLFEHRRAPHRRQVVLHFSA